MTLTVAIEALALGAPPQGIGGYSLNLVKALVSRPGDTRFICFLPRHGLPFFHPFEGPRLALVPCDLRGGRWGRLAFQHLYFRHLVGRYRYDVLHSLANLLPAGVPGRRVLTVHDLDFRVHPGNSPWLRRVLFGAMTPPSLRNADLVIADSEFTAGCLRRFYPRFPGERLRVVPLGSPPLAQSPEADRRAVLERRAIREPYFLSVGTLERRKNIPALVAAYERFREEHEGPWQLVVAGQPGFGAGEALGRIAASPRRPEINVAGYVAAQDLQALYSGATALIILSEAEGFGLPALEAMACGCPVIAAQAGSLPETCGSAALYVHPGDAAQTARAMRRLADRGPERPAMVEAGFANLARFSWQVHADVLTELYRRLAGG